VPKPISAVTMTGCGTCGRHNMILSNDYYGYCLYCRSERRNTIGDSDEPSPDAGAEAD
jgi:hypothetical protein